ncbi:hypothetical protein SKAU_G00344480 [Synaphobranchus kaupii]|uniref:Apoptosis-associated speck-like protein containing a CARD n=1 Tax=Synaphobranchus kaupii TaxID=118154 RepID=A0A9Q1EJA0_SYNKA|nr:hypothetical protein SKAU_G00344480 [Synaphobranchus kaupii]
MPKTERDRIIEALDDLSDADLDRFKHKLCETTGIGYGQIENQTVAGITRKIISKCTSHRAVAITAEVLRDIGQVDAAEKLLEENAGQVGARGETSVSSTSSSSSESKSLFVDKHLVKLINKVTMVEPILDDLLHKEIINSEMYNRIQTEKTNEDKMRKLMYDVIKPGGVRAKEELYRILEKEQPFMMEGLKGE